MKFSEHVVNLYMHEVAMQSDPSMEHERSGTEMEPVGEGAQAVELLTPAHVSALTICLLSIHEILDTLLALPTDVIRNLPNFNFIRTAQSCIMLIKLHYAVAASNSEVGRVMAKEDLRAEQYLERLLAVFAAAAEHDMCGPAKKFMTILMMMKAWFQRQGLGKSGKASQHATADAADARTEWVTARTAYGPVKFDGHDGDNNNNNNHVNGQVPADQPSQKAPSQNTPLHLLSEVAMGNSAPTPGSSVSVSAPGWNSQHSQGTPNMAFFGLGTPNSSQPLAGRPGGETEAMTNEELEQAMSMTLGDWDLTSVFPSEGFFDLDMGGPPISFEGFT